MTAKTTAPDFARLAPPSGSRMLVVGGCGAIGGAVVAAGLALDLQVAVFALERSLQASPPPEGAPVLLTSMPPILDPVPRWATARSASTGTGSIHWSIRLAFLPCRLARWISWMSWSGEAIQAGNLRSAFLTAQGALPLLLAAGQSSIVNVGSLMYV